MKAPNRKFRGATMLAAVACMVMLAGGAPVGAADVQLRQDFARLRERDYFLRIGITGDASQVRTRPGDECFLHDRFGHILHQGKAGETIVFRSRNGTPSSRACRWILRSFSGKDRKEADAFAAEARRRLEGLPVEVTEDPNAFHAPSPLTGKPHDDARLAVVVGPFAARESAMAVQSRVSAQYDAEFFESNGRYGRGTVVAADASGRELAQATDFLGLRCRSRQSLTRVDAPEQGSRAYRGSMEFWIGKKGTLAVVNRVFVEHYLYGVVPAEIGDHAPREAKKAQAVCARSEAIHKLGLRRHDGDRFDLCDQQHCQVYKGALAETPSCNAAVDATWGQVLVYGDEVIDAVYSMCCGGTTENAENAWVSPAIPYLRARYDVLPARAAPRLNGEAAARQWVLAKPDVFCSPDKPGYPGYAKEYFRWERRLPAGKLSRLLAAAGKPASGGVRDLRVTERGASGRAAEIRVTPVNGRAFTISGESAIRGALDDLPSTLFVIEQTVSGQAGSLGEIVIRGGGCGHGVGLCQMGAQIMARQGHGYLRILKHYYRGVEVYRIYE